MLDGGMEMKRPRVAEGEAIDPTLEFYAESVRVFIKNLLLLVAG